MNRNYKFVERSNSINAIRDSIKFTYEHGIITQEEYEYSMKAMKVCVLCKVECYIECRYSQDEKLDQITDKVYGIYTKGENNGKV